jgi:flagellar basal body-associated protein FliL
MLETTVFINGERMALNNTWRSHPDVFEHNGLTYVPIEIVAQMLGMDIEWNRQDDIMYVGHASPAYVNPVELPPVTPPPVTTAALDDIVTFSVGSTITRNLSNTGSGRGWYLQVDVSFEIDGKRDPDNILYNFMDERIDSVRDIINTTIGKYTYDDLLAVNGEDRLREDILQAVSDEFQTDLILRVNFQNIRYVPLG